MLGSDVYFQSASPAGFGTVWMNRRALEWLAQIAPADLAVRDCAELASLLTPQPPPRLLPQPRRGALFAPSRAPGAYRNAYEELQGLPGSKKTGARRRMRMRKRRLCSIHREMHARRGCGPASRESQM